MTQSSTRSLFTDELHKALAHLYDPTVIGESQLVEIFGLSDDEEAISTLQ